MTAPIRKLAIFGVGLIGGSVALALKRAGAVNEVVGAGRSRTNLEAALKFGIIDHIAATPEQAAQGADVVLLAVPVGQMAALMQKIAPHLDADALVTDAGSTKQDVAALMQQHFSGYLSNCVPGHPIAGAETSGAAAARADLYEGKNVVLTPLTATSGAAMGKAHALWEACGARISVMSASEHDAVFAAVSHLPHLLAYAYMGMIARRHNGDILLGFAASGFRDFTRIAGGNPEIWRDIALANRHALLEELTQYQADLEQMRAALLAEDGKALEASFKLAQQARSQWTGG